MVTLSVLNWFFEIFFLYKNEKDIVGLTGLRETKLTSVKRVKTVKKYSEPKISDLIRGAED